VLLVRKRAGHGAGRLYAMKVMPKAKYAGGDRSTAAFLERDVMLVARHPFLVRLRFAFQSPADLYLVTDYFEGGSLDDALRAAPGRRGLGAAAARHVVAELALGLDYLHARDVLHRDIKAANVLLDAAGHAHLCDFGLAKCVEAGGAPPGARRRSFAGTVEYMAPELLRKGGEAPGPPLDWWALGVLLVETVQGRTRCGNRPPVRVGPSDLGTRRASEVCSARSPLCVEDLHTSGNDLPRPRSVHNGPWFDRLPGPF